MLKEKYFKDQYLKHHGIKGQKWGQRRFQNKDGSLTPRGKLRYGVGTGADESKSDRSVDTSAKAGPSRSATLVPRNRGAVAKGGGGRDGRYDPPIADKSDFSKGRLTGSKSTKESGSKSNDQSPDKAKFGGREGEVIREANQRLTDIYSKEGGGPGGPKRSTSSPAKDNNGDADLKSSPDKSSKQTNGEDVPKTDAKREAIDGGKNKDHNVSNNKGKDFDSDSGIDKINKKEKERIKNEINDTKNAVNDITKGTESTTKSLSNMIDAIQNIQRHNKAKNSNVKVMSDAEIEKALYRMNLEQRYNQAKYGGAAMTGAEKAKTALATIGSIVGVAGGIVTLALGIKQLGNK